MSQVTIAAAVQAQLSSLQQQRSAGLLSAQMYISMAEELMGGSSSSGVPQINAASRARDKDGKTPA